MATAPSVKLNNGNEIPALGMGVVFLNTEGDAKQTQKTVDALQRLEMPAGVYIDIKMKTNS